MHPNFKTDVNNIHMVHTSYFIPSEPHNPVCSSVGNHKVVWKDSAAEVSLVKYNHQHRFMIGMVLETEIADISAINW